MKKSLISAAVVAFTIASGTLATEAGWKGKGKSWKFGHFHKFHHGHFHRGGFGCYKYKKLYYKTGRKFWLKKYYNCKF